MWEISYQDEVEQVIYRCSEERVIVAQAVYREQLTDVPEFTYYKALERMVERHKLLRLTKGIYFRGSIRTGKAEIHEEIIRYYTEAKGRFYTGVQVGKHLLEKYGLLRRDSVEVCAAARDRIDSSAEDFAEEGTYQREDNIRIYTTRISEQKKKICGIELLHLPCRLDREQCRYLELLEILQYYESSPQEIEAEELLMYVEKFAQDYEDRVMTGLLRKKLYPKHTIAFLKHLLEQQGCENGLDEFLAGTSRYRIPELAV